MWTKAFTSGHATHWSSDLDPGANFSGPFESGGLTSPLVGFGSSRFRQIRSQPGLGRG